jgi:lipopolysaccharide biosynthesis regulator YciM
MRIRTLLVFALVLVVLFGIILFWDVNKELLNQRFTITEGTTVGIGVALCLVFVLGVVLTAFLGIAREFGLMFERWRMRRASRKAEDIEEEYSRGLVAVLEGHDEEALRSFRAVLERDSRHFNTLIKLGEVLRRQGHSEEAVECHRKAQHLKPDNTRPLHALVEDYEARGDMERARGVLGKILAIDKSSIAAWGKLRSLHVKEKNWDEAIKAQGRIERLSGGRAQDADRRCGVGIRYELAMARLEEGKTREAVAGFQKLIKENDAFIPAHVGLGEGLREAGNEADAIEAWHRGFESTGSPIFLTLLENHHLQREHPMAAIEALKKCISRARRDTVPRFYLGKLYFRLEMLDDALEVLSSLEGRSASAPSLHYLLGRIHERRENWRPATAAYRTVILETELVRLEYRCRACSAAVADWTHRCEACGEWNTIEVDFREEIPLEELGLAPAPIYTIES